LYISVLMLNGNSFEWALLFKKKIKVNVNCMHLIITLTDIFASFSTKTVQILKLVKVLINVDKQMDCAAKVDIMRSIPCLCLCGVTYIKNYRSHSQKETKGNLSFRQYKLVFCIEKSN
jgi:hypothetical protein